MDDKIIVADSSAALLKVSYPPASADSLEASPVAPQPVESCI
jgi:hypothetical protein